MTETTRKTYPVQNHGVTRGERSVVNDKVALAAYEVYCEVHSPQPALIEGDCRGGLGVGETIAFLYARSFPRNEWRARADEAHKGMNL